MQRLARCVLNSLNNTCGSHRSICTSWTINWTSSCDLEHYFMLINVRHLCWTCLDKTTMGCLQWRQSNNWQEDVAVGGDGWHTTKALKCLMKLKEKSMLSFYLSITFNFSSLLYNHVMVNQFREFRQLKQGSMNAAWDFMLNPIFTLACYFSSFFQAQNKILCWKMYRNKINKVCISAFNWKTDLLQMCSCLIYLWCTKEVWFFRGVKTHKIPTVSHFYSDVMATKPTQTTLVTFVTDRLEQTSATWCKTFPATADHSRPCCNHTPSSPQREPAASILHPGPQNNDVTPRRLMQLICFRFPDCEIHKVEIKKHAPPTQIHTQPKI